MNLSKLYYVELNGNQIVGCDNLNNAKYKAYEFYQKDKKSYSVRVSESKLIAIDAIIDFVENN